MILFYLISDIFVNIAILFAHILGCSFENFVRTRLPTSTRSCQGGSKSLATVITTRMLLLRIPLKVLANNLSMIQSRLKHTMSIRRDYGFWSSECEPRFFASVHLPLCFCNMFCWRRPLLGQVSLCFSKKQFNHFLRCH